MTALLSILKQYGDSPDFLEGVLGDRADEFEIVVAGVIADWEDIADSVAGNYPAMQVDRVPTVLHDPAGLEALRRDLASAIGVLDASAADR